jgi:hypothetical protein
MPEGHYRVKVWAHGAEFLIVLSKRVSGETGGDKLYDFKSMLRSKYATAPVEFDAPYGQVWIRPTSIDAFMVLA